MSVIIPTHNRADLLGLTLHSVLWQADVDFEAVVVDDGSTDGTREVVASFKDRRVRLIRHERTQGVSAARNHGIAEARGAWIAFLDDDDLWAPDKLKAQLQAAHVQARRWVYVGEVNVTVDLHVLGGAPPLPPEEVVAGLPRANLVPVGCSGVIVHTSVLPPDPFDGSYYHCADWDLWIRLARTGHPAWVRRPLVGYRIHPGNASLDTEGMIAELDIIERRYGGPVDRARFYRHVARVSQRANRRRDAIRYYTLAAARDHRYRRQGFAVDIAEISQGLIREGRARMARAIGADRQPRQRTDDRRPDPYRSWKDEARSWVQELSGRHA